MRTTGELAGADRGIANIGAACDIGKEKLAKECTEAEAMCGRECGMFRCILKGACILIEGGNSIGGEGSDGLPRMFRCRSAPVVRAEDAVDVGLT